MKYLRAVFSGSVVWILISITFMILTFIPVIKESLNQQALVVAILIVPYSLFGAYLYYKDGNKHNGLLLGIIMVVVALLLDALITVPFIEIPSGGSYISFYFYPVLWVFVGINIATVYLFWKVKIDRKHNL